MQVVRCGGDLAPSSFDVEMKSAPPRASGGDGGTRVKPEGMHSE